MERSPPSLRTEQHARFVSASPYTLVTTIARGGMGYVELCARRDGRFLRWCARKRLHEQFRSDATFRSMFMDEGRLAGLVRHPNAVGVLDVGEDEDGPFLIMDFVEGVSLSRVIADAAAASRPIAMQVGVRICLAAALGLHAAHEVRADDGTILHLVHRDVSPQNILIGFDGSVRVTDFGIAKALGNTTRTSAGVLKGNMGYLSPEQLRFEEPDRRSDLFSLGVTLYELLSGLRLYPNTDGFDGTRRILTEPPPDIGDVRNDVPAELVELLLELLAKGRESRPTTAAEIAARLEAILAALIADEGSITVADHMEQYFAGECRSQREFLIQELRRLDASDNSPRPQLRLDVPTARISIAGDKQSVRGSVRWYAGGLVLALATVLVGVALWGRSASKAVSRRVQTAAVDTMAEVLSPPPVIVDSEVPAPSPDVAPSIPSLSTAGGTSPAHPVRPTGRMSRSRAKPPRRVSAARGAGESLGGRRSVHSELDIPLFTKWQ